MTYGKRLSKAMAIAGLDQPALAKRVRELRKEDGLPSANIGQQTISKALRSAKSVYTSWFARALGVSFEWLESEIGDMQAKPASHTHVSASDWPFPMLDPQHYQRLRPQDKEKIESLVLALVDAFDEAETGTGPPQKKIERKRR